MIGDTVFRLGPRAAARRALQEQLEEVARARAAGEHLDSDLAEIARLAADTARALPAASRPAAPAAPSSTPQIFAAPPRSTIHVPALRAGGRPPETGASGEAVPAVAAPGSPTAGTTTTVPPARRRGGGKPKGKYARITETQLRALHVAYTTQGLSVRQLAAKVWEKLGYASERSCATCLYELFKDRGFELRSQRDAMVAVNFKHGLATRAGRKNGHNADYRRYLREKNGTARPLCAAVRTQYPRKGQPCQARAQRDSAYCPAHDPERATARAQHLEQMRARVREGGAA